jgi:hypothetical protein
VRCDAQRRKRCQLSHSTAHPLIPSLEIGSSTTSYRTMALAMNMISRSHGSHMKIILCDVYLLPRLGRDRSDVRWVLATEVSRSDG